MRYNFEWDAAKARQNVRKHGVNFERAAEVFLDPLAASLPDPVHDDERWITLGVDSCGVTLLLVHTFSELSSDEAKIRIISAREPTRREALQYEEADDET